MLLHAFVLRRAARAPSQNRDRALRRFTAFRRHSRYRFATPAAPPANASFTPSCQRSQKQVALLQRFHIQQRTRWLPRVMHAFFLPPAQPSPLTLALSLPQQRDAEGLDATRTHHDVAVQDSVA